MTQFLKTICQSLLVIFTLLFCLMTAGNAFARSFQIIPMFSSPTGSMASILAEASIYSETGKNLFLGIDVGGESYNSIEYEQWMRTHAALSFGLSELYNEQSSQWVVYRIQAGMKQSDKDSYWFVNQKFGMQIKHALIGVDFTINQPEAITNGVYVEKFTVSPFVGIKL
ncbi:MAG: hypothetical protein ACOH5I_17425 [Oligoflexus sp.]